MENSVAETSFSKRRISRTDTLNILTKVKFQDGKGRKRWKNIDLEVDNGVDGVDNRIGGIDNPSFEHNNDDSWARESDTRESGTLLYDDIFPNSAMNR